MFTNMSLACATPLVLAAVPAMSATAVTVGTGR